MHRTLLLVAALLVAGTVPAQAEGLQFSVNTARYDSTGTGLGVTAGAETLGLLRGGGGVSFFFADRPFSLFDNSSGSRELWGVVMQSMLGTQVHGAIGFDYADFSVIVPVAPVMIWGSDPTFGDFPVGDRDSAAFGDIVLLPKVRILDINKLPVGLAVQIPVSLPTGMKARYFGDAGVNVELDIVAEARFWKMRVLANVSPIHVRPKVEYGNFVRQFGMNWNFGASISPATNVFVQAEAWGSVAYQGTVSQATAEWAASIKMQATDFVALQFGAGSGIVGVGAPRLRAYAGLQFTSPDTRDSDLDGVPDAKDECPDDQETFNGVDDEDGCPDEDTAAPAAEATDAVDEAVEEVVDPATEAVDEAAEEAATEATEAVKEAATEATGAVDEATEAVEGAATEATEAVEEAAAEATEAVEEAAAEATEAVEEAAEDATEAVEEATEAVEEAAEAVEEAAEEAPAAATEAVEEAAEDATEAVEEAAAPATEAAPETETP